MSARDSIPTQLSEIAALLPQLKTAREALSEARITLDTLHMRNGQAIVSIHFAGRTIPLTVHDRSYMPVKVAGRKALLDCLIREQQDFVAQCAGAVEGLEFRLQRLAKSTPTKPEQAQ